MTFLLTWNPNKFHWAEYRFMSNFESFPLYLNWSVCSRKMKAGDEFYLLMQGMGKDNGIVGYGTFVGFDALGNPSTDPEVPLCFDEYAGRTRLVDIRMEALWDYQRAPYVQTSVLKYLFPAQCWSPQSSGIQLAEEIEQEVRKLVRGEAESSS